MKIIIEGLADLDKDKVKIYIDYLKALDKELDKEGKKKNWWFSKITESEYVAVFRKVFDTGLFIDGESITLNYRKKLLVTYDYHAYKNKITLNYPESVFDFQVVYKDDTFSFAKESGKVIYSHKIADPFSNDKKIVGAYGVLKNSRGEFIEFLNTSTIEQMKNTSLMKNIWKAWEDRMVLKSIIKRICSAHFKDLVKEIDTLDNESNEPERAGISEDIQKEIDEAKTVEEINAIYKKYNESIEDLRGFIAVIGSKKQELLKVKKND